MKILFYSFSQHKDIYLPGQKKDAQTSLSPDAIIEKYQGGKVLNISNNDSQSKYWVIIL